MTHTFKLKTLVSALSMAGLLAACGGGGGTGDATTAGSGNTTGDSATAAVSGTVADGYLVGATVCLDKNANGACDAAEPKAVTGAGGKYEIAGITAAEARLYAVVAEVPATAVDEDTGTAVGGSGYVLAAPAGKPEFVSPLTTLVHKEVKEGGGLSVDEAEAKVKNNLGMTEEASLLKDYVKEKKSDQTYDHLHKVAQVLATVIKEERTTIQTLATQAGVSEEQATNVILDKVMARLAPVLEEVKKGATVAGAVSTAGLTRENLSGSVTKDDVKAEADRKELLASAVVSNPLDAWKEALYGLDVWTETPAGSAAAQIAFYVGQMISPDGKTLTEKSFRRLGTGDWQADTKDQNVVLTETGWKVVSDGVNNLTITPEGDHLNVLNPASGASMTVRVAAIDLAGKSVHDMLEKVARSDAARSLSNRIAAAARFSDGAKGQMLQIIHESDEYHLWTGGESNGAVWVNGKQADTLAALVSTATQFSPNNAIGYGSDGLSVVLGPEGKAYFGKVNWQSQGTTSATGEYTGPTWKSLGSGSWERRTVNGQELIVVPLSGERRQDSDRHALIFAVYEGGVRGGGLRVKGGVEQELEYNWTALKDLESAIKVTLAYFSLPSF